ncbi:MAG: hypothetical protein ACD_49C00049G0010 [uncultured bacterium (gcode 4)]|uniref:Uncharacterized protein n=1 Tax=uncultured bacterium (gcode 4) TaxID=1234023 RepID=K2AX75_9BACT|nr:MAG: hypothetical protein ACD_49C00049G0010 [uncultured bacterium (gcode 4)]
MNNNINTHETLDEKNTISILWILAVTEALFLSAWKDSFVSTVIYSKLAYNTFLIFALINLIILTLVSFLFTSWKIKNFKWYLYLVQFIFTMQVFLILLYMTFYKL